MQLFGEYRDQPILSVEDVSAGASVSMLAKTETAALVKGRVPRGIAADGALLSDSDLRDQFILFQFNEDPDGPSILESSQVSPTHSGSTDKPDSHARVRLASFHVGSGEQIDKKARATLRLDLGKDSTSESPLDTIFWSVAVGMNLYNEIKGGPSDAKDLKTDFNSAFSNRPVEIPGSLGSLSFEVVKHKEPKWWQKIFSFLQSGTGKALTAAVGFPAITGQAVGFLDELLDRLDRSDPEVLFKSRPLTLAFTERARMNFTGGLSNVGVGVINSGFCLLARGRDYKTLLEQDPVYMGAHGLLKPKDMDLEEFLASPGSNPFNGMTYGVLKVATVESKLNPLLDFGG